MFPLTISSLRDLLQGKRSSSSLRRSTASKKEGRNEDGLSVENFSQFGLLSKRRWSPENTFRLLKRLIIHQVKMTIHSTSIYTYGQTYRDRYTEYMWPGIFVFIYRERGRKEASNIDWCMHTEGREVSMASRANSRGYLLFSGKRVVSFV